MDRFEAGVTGRLRAELDTLEVRLPVPAYRLRQSRSWPAFGVLRPLAVAAAAVIALAALATAVTRSPDPARWVQPSVWMRALGVGPASPPPASTEPAKAAPATSSEAEPRAEPTGAEREPSETPNTSPSAHESPDSPESEAPTTSSGSSPPQGPDG